MRRRTFLRAAGAATLLAQRVPAAGKPYFAYWGTYTTLFRSYYAMRRHADGMFNAKTGRYDGISTAYRMKLVSVFVVDPDQAMAIPVRDGGMRGRKGYDDTMAAMIKAADTLVPQEVPPGSGENAVGKGGVPLGRGAGRGGRGPTTQTGNTDKDK